MVHSAWTVPSGFLARLEQLSEDHQRGIFRFGERLSEFAERGQLTSSQCEVVAEHLVRLGERSRNPANTGNIEDLFCHTLNDTNDPIRAYAQALADSVKVVPMEKTAKLRPPMRTLDKSRWYYAVDDFDHLTEADRMLVAHTMVAYGDEEMWRSAATFVRVTDPRRSEPEIQRTVARMAVQSQHLPSSTFVLARAHGLTIECTDLYREAGYEEARIQNAQSFYDVCAQFDPKWADDFLDGRIPSGEGWISWRSRYLELRSHLPPELVYQLTSDTLSNFLDATLESGKWTDASVLFGGVSQPADVPQAIARIVNQYLAEHIALHDRPATELMVACAKTLKPWGIGFDDERAVVLPQEPEKAELLEAQFHAAWARKNS